MNFGDKYGDNKYNRDVQINIRVWWRRVYIYIYCKMDNDIELIINIFLPWSYILLWLEEKSVF